MKALALLVCLGLLVAAPSASAAVFTVNSTAGGDDLNFGGAFDGICDADPTADVDCTLKAAIQEANATVAADGIGFQKTSDSGGGDPDDQAFVNGQPPAVVTIAGPLPTIAAGLSISGGNCAGDLPMIDDPPTPCVMAPNLVVNSSGEVTLTGLAFGNTGTSIDVNIVGVRPEPEFTLINSWFGVDTVGDPTAAAPTTDVLLRGETQGARIGGDPQTGPNIFARHNGVAIDILGADNTEITVNEFGVLPDGSFARAGEGLSVNGDNIEVNGDSTPNPDDQATGTVIGFADSFSAATPECDGGCNLIDGAGASEQFSLSDGAAIDLQGDGGPELPAAGATIVGNHIGVGNGVTTRPPNLDGILVGDATGVTIGGPAAGNANRNRFDGDPISSLAGASDLLIENNTGVGALALQGSGEVIDNFFGQTSTPIQLSNTSAPNFTIQGNSIGVGPSGGPTIITGPFGIRLASSANGNLIGGTGPGEGNLISDFAQPGAPSTRGIEVAGDSNTIVGNRIGPASNGSALAGLIDGVALVSDADDNIIGGSTAASENAFSKISDDAIVVTGADSDGNQILRNRGFDNGDAAGDLFIDLGDDGFGNLAEPNGPNTGAQAPTIALASATTASGVAAPGATLRLFTKASASAGELEGFLSETTASGGGAWVATFPAQADGKLLAATSTAAGNTSELSAAVAVDAAAPQTQIDSGPADGGAISNTTPTFGFSATEAGSTFECRIDGAAFAACSGPGATHTPAALADGPHTFEVRATDAAANTDASPASRTFTVDTGPPDTQIDSGPAAGATTGDSTPTLGFSASEPGSSFECRLDFAALAPCSGPGATHTPAALADGPHTFEVRATDAAGNVDASPATRVFTVDATPPDTQIGSGLAAGAVTRDRTPTFGFSATEAGSSFECRIDAAAFAACSGPGAAHTPVALGNGRHAFEVRATDAVGNRDATPATRAFTVDADPPETRIAKRPKKTTTRRVAKFRFRSDEAGSTFRCKLDKGRFKRCKSPLRKRVKPGRHVLRVRAIDRAGNADPTPAKTKWRVRR